MQQRPYHPHTTPLPTYLIFRKLLLPACVPFATGHPLDGWRRKDEEAEKNCGTEAPQHLERIRVGPGS